MYPYSDSLQVVQLDTLQEDGSDGENHSCEDEELVLLEPTSNKLFDAL